MSMLSRRDAIIGIGGAAAAAAMASTPGARAQAAEPSTPPAEPVNGAGFYKFAVGDVTCYALGDGQGRLPSFPLWGENAGEQAVKDALSPYAIDPAGMLVHFNVLMFKVAGDVWLIDAGNGPSGSNPGQTMNRLRSLGVAPDLVAGIVISHLHGDHYGGLFDEKGALAFPKAKYFLHKTESEFWKSPDLSGTSLPEDWKKNMTSGAGKALAALEASGRLQIVGDRDTLTSGVSVRHTGGHTPGHLTVVIDRAGQKFQMMADAFHHWVLSFTHPEWHVKFDFDAKQGAAVRRETLARLADEKALVMGYHTPWPGVGRVMKDAGAFRWVAEPWAW